MSGVRGQLWHQIFYDAYCVYFSSLKDLKGQEAAIIASVTILGEAINFMQMIGEMMILGFTLLNEITLKS